MNLNELAAHLGVSPASVSIVRKGRAGVSGETRRRIQLALEENGYEYLPYTGDEKRDRPSDSGWEKSILLLKYYDSTLLVNKNEGFVDSIISSIDALIRKNRYNLVIHAVSKEDFRRFLNGFSRDKWAGLLVIATEMSREEILSLRQLDIPMVILDSDWPDLPFSSVTMDNRSLSQAAVGALRSRGSVGHIASRIPTGNFCAREAGYLEAVRRFGLPYDEKNIFRVTPSLSGAYEDMKGILSGGRSVPGALFAANDVIAIGAMKALREAGMTLPDDVAVIGVDNTMIAQVSTPTLTSAYFSRNAIGQQAMGLLLEEISDPSRENIHIRVGARLIMRDST